MVAVLLSPLYIGMNIYLLSWLLRWMKSCHRIFIKKWVQVVIICVFSFCSLALVPAFFMPVNELHRILKHIGNYWLGVLWYAAFTVVIADLIRIAYRKIKHVPKGVHNRRALFLGGLACITIIGGFSIAGFIGAHDLQTTNYTVEIDKPVEGMDSMKVVLVSDLHLGYSVGVPQMENMVKAINAEKPDIVVMAGDIFDNEYDALDDPEKLEEILRGIKSKYGVYACYGNHDVDEKLLMGFTFGLDDDSKASDVRMDEFLKKANIKLLSDECVLIDNKVYLFGRADADKPGKFVTVPTPPEEITANMDKSKPILVLDHQPVELNELADAGVDLDMNGHTHNGQFFPGNLTIRVKWPHAYGLKKYGDMSDIVTSGVGVYGPSMRVGAKAEIASIDVKFNNK